MTTTTTTTKKIAGKLIKKLRKKYYIKNFFVAIAYIVSLSGFYTNIYTSFFATSGYSLIYNQTYNWATTSSEINSFRSQCTASSILCVGGGDSSTITLAACGNCFVVTNQTVRNVPVLDSGVWWYYTSPYSFGFSQVSSINQNNADTYTDSSAYRLSWHLDNNSGGWRLGDSISLYSETIFKMVFVN